MSISNTSQDKAVEQVKDSLGKIAEAIDDNVLYSDDECEGVCDNLSKLPKEERNQKLWNKCGCKE